MLVQPQTILALDGMGGDYAPEAVLDGAVMAQARRSDIRFQIHGPERMIRPALQKRSGLAAHATIVDAETFVSMDEPPAQALRRTRKTSSMWRAIASVRKGNAHAALSGGNTGALMAMSKLVLKTLPGVRRPAIGALWPTMRGTSLVLDLGATINSDARQLVHFALMGSACARIVLDTPTPSVGLLNVGIEGIKGTEILRDAARIIEEGDFPFDFKGFIEGSDIARGTTDVIVTDGFTGNVALKSAEGTALQIRQYLREALTSSWIARFGAFFAQGALRTLGAKVDPRNFNGGIFLGLGGIVVKSHGGSDAHAVAAAIDTAATVARARLGDSVAHVLNGTGGTSHAPA